MIKKNKHSKIGATLLLIVFFSLFSFILARFFYIPFNGKIDGVDLAKRTELLYTKKKSIASQRGTIEDNNHNILASDMVSYNLYAVLDKKAGKDLKGNPLYVDNYRDTAKKLSKCIDMSEEEIYKMLKKKKYQVEFWGAGHGLSSEVKAKIDSYHLSGIYFTQKDKRLYSINYFASHTIGVVQTETDQSTGLPIEIGQIGLEKQYNKYLTGVNGLMRYRADSKGRIFPSEKPIIKEAKNGKTLVTTFDKKIQSVLEDAMTKVNNKYKPAEITAIVADPKTGAILAMAQRPSFDLNTKEGINSTWFNLPIEHSYEPGSTFKVFTLSAAVNEGVFDPKATFKSGSYKVLDQTIHDHERGGWGTITYLQAVQNSSNVGFAKIGMELLGPDKLREYITRFGFDKKTGIVLPREANSKIVFRYPIEKATTAFGQGTAVTPIQQVQAFTAVATNGEMKQPFLVNQIVDPVTGKVDFQHKTKIAGTPITAETAKQVREYLATVVTKGTGKPYAIKGFESAGKTGTAQIAGPDGKYLKGHGNFIFSYLGMAPKDNPKLIMYVSVKQPDITLNQSGHLPGSIIYKEVMENALKYIDINQPQKNVVPTIKMPNFYNEIAPNAVDELKNIGMNPIVVGYQNAKVINQYPKTGDSILKGEKILLMTSGKMTMPNLKGWSVRDVMKLAALTGIDLKIEGQGFAAKQTILPGADIYKGQKITVTFKPPI